MATLTHFPEAMEVVNVWSLQQVAAVWLGSADEVVVLAFHLWIATVPEVDGDELVPVGIAVTTIPAHSTAAAARLRSLGGPLCLIQRRDLILQVRYRRLVGRDELFEMHNTLFGRIHEFCPSS